MGSDSGGVALKAARVNGSAEGVGAVPADAAPTVSDTGAPQPRTMARIANRLIKRISQPKPVIARLRRTLPRTIKDANRNTVPQACKMDANGLVLPQFGAQDGLES